MVSLIIATRDRPMELSRLFQSLCDQTSRNFEIILVDQGIHPFLPTFTNPVSYTHIVDNGIGLSRARNIGLKFAKGEILAFPDDDCWYPPDLIERVLSFFETHQDICILSGCYGEPEYPNPNFPLKSGKLTTTNFLNRVSSVTLFINQKGLKQNDLVLFDENLGVGTSLPGAEELDLTLRLLKKNYKGWYDPSLKIFHKVKFKSGEIKWNDMLSRELAQHYFLMKAAITTRHPYYFLKVILRLVYIRPGMKYPLKSHMELRRQRIRGYLLAVRNALYEITNK